MKTPRENPLLCALLSAAFVSSVPLAAASAPGDQDARPATAPATAPARPLSIHFAGGDRKLDRAALKSALETELGQPVTLTDSPDAALRVEVVARDRVSVAYRAPDGQTLSRSVDLPAEDDRAVEVIAWLSGNLARDEASDLLRSLRGDVKSAESAAPGEPASATPVPKPEPEPTKPAQEAPKPAPQPAPEEPARPKPLELRPLVFNASLFHPLAIFPDSHERRVNFELGFVYSRVGAIDGFAITPGVLAADQGVDGAAIGSLWFAGAGDSHGLIVSSVGTYRAGALVGAEIAGATTLGGGPLTGMSVAGAFGLSGPATGVTIAGAAVVGEGVNGLSIAGAATVQQGDTHGALIAGAATVARRVDGLVIAGAVNHAGDVSGLQIAGVSNSAATLDGVAIATINAHGKVRGLQLGVVNVAEEVDGAALGVVSIAKNGRVQPIAYWSSFAPAHAGVKFVVGWAYSEIGMGFAGDEYMPKAGMGAHIPVWEDVYLEPGAHFSSTHATDSNQNAKHVDSYYRLRAGVRLLDAVEVFAGGGARHGIWGTTEDQWKPEVLAGIAIF